MTDYRTLRLPDALVIGVRKLCERLDGDPEAIRDYMAFGDLASVPGNPELSLCLDRVDPWTLVCDHCGDVALSVVGGTVIEPPPAGAVCPFCKFGTLSVVPMLLRRLHWVTGQRVDPDIEEDIRTIPGVRIPLTDDAICRWVSMEISRHLRDLAAEAGVPLYGILACMNLKRGMFKRVDVAAPEFLGSPDIYDVARGQIPELLDEAARFLDAREVRNTPRVFLTDGARRDAFTPITIGLARGRSTAEGSYRYLVEGLIGRGAKCDVFRARLDREPTEFVIVKLLAAEGDEDLLRAEIANVRTLMASNERGSELMKRAVPRLVAHGKTVCPDGETREVVVYRDEHGADWSLAQCLQAYPNGLDVKTVVWMMNRLLLQMSWWHDTGLIHGAILPEHLLVHPRDHTLWVIDWSAAVKPGSQLKAGVEGREDFYPPEVMEGRPVDEQTDMAMACRVMIAMLGGDAATGKLPELVPSQLVDLLVTNARYARIEDHAYLFTNAMDFYRAWESAAAAAFGPKAYHPFHMPPQAAARS